MKKHLTFIIILLVTFLVVLPVNAEESEYITYEELKEKISSLTSAEIKTIESAHGNYIFDDDYYFEFDDTDKELILATPSGDSYTALALYTYSDNIISCDITGVSDATKLNYLYGWNIINYSITTLVEANDLAYVDPNYWIGVEGVSIEYNSGYLSKISFSLNKDKIRHGNEKFVNIIDMIDYINTDNYYIYKLYPEIFEKYYGISKDEINNNFKFVVNDNDYYISIVSRTDKDKVYGSINLNSGTTINFQEATSSYEENKFAFAYGQFITSILVYNGYPKDVFLPVGKSVINSFYKPDLVKISPYATESILKLTDLSLNVDELSTAKTNGKFVQLPIQNNEPTLEIKEIKNNSVKVTSKLPEYSGDTTYKNYCQIQISENGGTFKDTNYIGLCNYNNAEELTITDLSPNTKYSFRSVALLTNFYGNFISEVKEITTLKDTEPEEPKKEEKEDKEQTEEKKSEKENPNTGIVIKYGVISLLLITGTIGYIYALKQTKFH